jgi:hypothetical protein
VLRAALGDAEPKRMLLGLGACQRPRQDVSWIWDVDFESLAGLVPAPVVSGNRAADLAVRLKYAGWLGDGRGRGGAVGARIESDPTRAVRVAIDRTPPGQPLWVVSTPAELSEIRRWLRHQGHVPDRPAELSGHVPSSRRAIVRAAAQLAGSHTAGPQPSGPQPSGPPRSAPPPAAPPLSGHRPDRRSQRGWTRRRRGQAGAVR